MCTVTAVLNNKNFTLTSNRDISLARAHSLPPRIISCNDIEILSPIDPEGGGTWIGVSDKYVACLLNNSGIEDISFESRGVLVNKILSEMISLQELPYKSKLYNPYLLLLFNRKKQIFLELTWDGTDYTEKAVTNKYNIWLSTTIYSKEEILEKRKSFSRFYSKGKKEEDILAFHEREENLKDSDVKTTSITQVHNSVGVVLTYKDLIDKESYRLKFSK